MNKILRINAICELLEISKATIYREIKKGNFPAPIQLTERNVGWLKTDIDEWILSRKKVNLSLNIDMLGDKL